MDKFDYTKARATAERLISKFGQPGTFVKSGAKGGYDDYGDPIADEPDIVINGTVTPLLQYKQSEIDGQNIIMGDSYAYFHSDAKPEVEYEHTQNGDKYRVVSVYDMTSVDGINVFVRVQLRR